jgi:rubrerythrin
MGRAPKVARPHEWVWIETDQKYFFGDPDKPYAVDVWRCSECGKEVVTRGYRDPTPGRCPGRK